jgi:hypothetical protein
MVIFNSLHPHCSYPDGDYRRAAPRSQAYVAWRFGDYPTFVKDHPKYCIIVLEANNYLGITHLYPMRCAPDVLVVLIFATDPIQCVKISISKYMTILFWMHKFILFKKSMIFALRKHFTKVDCLRA